MIKIIKETIIKEDKIEFILNKLGCEKIDLKHEEWVYSNYPNGDNPKGVCINKRNLAFSSKSNHGKGDIISLAMQILNIELSKALDWFKFNLGIVEYCKYTPKKILFGGLYKDMKSNFKIEKSKIYDISILNSYKNIPNIKFLQDGISLETQLKYKIMYDEESDRIIIPYFTDNGLIGISGRINYNNMSYKIPKYMAMVNYKKTRSLYGLYENYKNLVSNRIYVFEAEKSVMIADSMGIYNTVAVGHCGISRTQKNILLSLNPSEVIVCFDEGISEQTILDICKIFKTRSNLLKCKVGYIYDEDNKYLRKYEKESPIESKNWEELIKNNIKYLSEE